MFSKLTVLYFPSSSFSRRNSAANLSKPSSRVSADDEPMDQTPIKYPLLFCAVRQRVISLSLSRAYLFPPLPLSLLANHVNASDEVKEYWSLLSSLISLLLLTTLLACQHLFYHKLLLLLLPLMSLIARRSICELIEPVNQTLYRTLSHRLDNDTEERKWVSWSSVVVVVMALPNLVSSGDRRRSERRWCSLFHLRKKEKCRRLSSSVYSRRGKYHFNNIGKFSSSPPSHLIFFCAPSSTSTTAYEVIIFFSVAAAAAANGVTFSVEAATLSPLRKLLLLLLLWWWKKAKKKKRQQQKRTPNAAPAHQTLSLSLSRRSLDLTHLPPPPLLTSQLRHTLWSMITHTHLKTPAPPVQRQSSSPSVSISKLDQCSLQQQQ